MSVHSICENCHFGIDMCNCSNGSPNWNRIEIPDAQAIASALLDGEAEKRDQRIHAFRDLQEDWDSYGALPPDPKAIAKARKFAKMLREQPHVQPTANGGIGFEWDDCVIEITATADDDHFWIDDESI